MNRINDIIGTFVWEHGSRNDNGIRLLRERMIPYQYYMFELYAKDAVGNWCKVEYEKLPPAPNRHPDTWCVILNRNNTAKLEV